MIPEAYPATTTDHAPMTRPQSFSEQPHGDGPFPEISFFVPCYNEERNIAATLATIARAVDGVAFEILVVDDGSRDRTAEIVQDQARSRPDLSVRLIQHEVNRGLGYNYFKTSFLARGQYYMLVNGDNVEPEETIRRIVSRRGTADMVIPFFGGNDSRTLTRRLISRTFTFLTNLISGHRIRYYNGPVLHLTENVRFWRSETIGYGYQAELICHLLNHGYTHEQVEVRNGDREWGTSKAFGLGNWLSVANSLVHILLRRITGAAYRLLNPDRRHRP